MPTLTRQDSSPPASRPRPSFGAGLVLREVFVGGGRFRLSPNELPPSRCFPRLFPCRKPVSPFFTMARLHHVRVGPGDHRFGVLPPWLDLRPPLTRRVSACSPPPSDEVRRILAQEVSLLLQKNAIELVHDQLPRDFTVVFVSSPSPRAVGDQF